MRKWLKCSHMYIFVMTVFMLVFADYVCATWIWFAILSETWFSLCIFTSNVIACFFWIFHDAWKGQLLLREVVFRRGIGDPLWNSLWWKETRLIILNSIFQFSIIIPHKRKVLFAYADWLARRWIVKYYSPPSSRRKHKMAFLTIFQK